MQILCRVPEMVERFAFVLVFTFFAMIINQESLKTNNGK